MPTPLFFIYDPQDTPHIQEIERQLQILVTNQLVSYWHAGKLLAGSNSNDVTEAQLKNAQIVLPIVSANFLASGECNKWLQIADKLSKHIAPIIASSCLWDSDLILAQKFAMPAQPNNTKIIPITHWDKPADAYTTIAKAIKNVVENLLPDTYTENALGIGLIMKCIKDGAFLMGRSESRTEQPHHVTLSNFYIGAYQVTQAQWVAVMGDNPSYFKGDNLPVECVSWDDIQVFLQKLNAKSRPFGGKGGYYRLPTEAEWEYAARGGRYLNNYIYAGSNHLDEVGWYIDNSDYKTHPVGQKQANELGLYDMSGNVWEWCNDWHDEHYYNNSPLNNPTGPTIGTSRVLRGGVWGSVEWYCRVDDRRAYNPGSRDRYAGFRVAVSVP